MDFHDPSPRWDPTSEIFPGGPHPGAVHQMHAEAAAAEQRAIEERHVQERLEVEGHLLLLR